MKILTTSLVIMLVALVAGCSDPITKQDKESMAAPINCATAEGDIRVLNSEKAHISKEMASGASSIIPISLVANLIEGHEKDSFRVGFGEYNKAIDKKIAQIKSTCNIK